MRAECRAPLIWRTEIYEELESTSDTCLARAEAGEAEGLAVLALRQTKGRGSRGRSWEDPGGNLALSVILRPDGRYPSFAGFWPFLLSLAFRDGILACLSDLSAGTRLRLKWPNDVLLDGCKLGGMLIERGGVPGREWLVAGFGANLVRVPQIDGRDLACLAQVAADRVFPPAEVAIHILDAVSRYLALAEAEGFGPVRAAWLDAALPVGTRLVARGGNTYIEGEFTGIGPDGALILRTAEGLRSIATAEILLADGADRAGAGEAVGTS
ncbi:biotin--[acetyl-CoA-carboxylase] ligase [Acetobacter sp. AN02]|uniref:biotin--[acetyl-CoA-carboxylase] ligase n=1 Tax=Acetobacter sp. AN02 TaxID=2894186 RepID=UPI00243417F8|nr:biotin--[acetyl-CoA-carboxylase] ligase [Acetobacter sp. AN02]MDG6094577.1 biotin--[acetyl-CoA-carboxylase] ligase [Acetobacter sp. AN02]